MQKVQLRVEYICVYAYSQQTHKTNSSIHSFAKNIQIAFTDISHK